MSLHSHANSLTPRSPLSLRIIGMPGDVTIAMTEHLHLVFPKSWVIAEESRRIQFCNRLKELGYNSLIFYAKDQVASHAGDIAQHLSLFKSQGIQIFLQPLLTSSFVQSPVNPDYRTLIGLSLRELLRAYPQIDGIYWKSMLHHRDYTAPSEARDALQYDLILKELRTLEEAIGTQKMLIFSMPTASIETAQREASWLETLCDDAGPETYLSYSAVAGDPCWDHLPPHPFWERLRKREEAVSTPLLPVINTGGIGQGEGLWPTLAFDLFERYFTRLRRHRFGGVINLSAQLPAGPGPLACNLWVAGQLMDREEMPEWLLEEWFRKHRQDWSYARLSLLLRQIRLLVLDFSRLKHQDRENLSSEERRVFFDSLFLQVKQLQTSLIHSEKKSTFLDYFDVFARDVRRSIKVLAQHYHVGITQLWTGEDKAESFWTDGQKLLEQPSCGASGSLMERIYKENRLL